MFSIWLPAELQSPQPTWAGTAAEGACQVAGRMWPPWPGLGDTPPSHTHRWASISELETWKVGDALREPHTSQVYGDPGIVLKERRWDLAHTILFITTCGQSARGPLQHKVPLKSVEVSGAGARRQLLGPAAGPSTPRRSRKHEQAGTPVMPREMPCPSGQVLSRRGWGTAEHSQGQLHPLCAETPAVEWSRCRCPLTT